MTLKKFNPENAEFNQKNDFNGRLFETLIPKFDKLYRKELKTDMIRECSSILQRVEMLSMKIKSEKRDDSNLIRPWTIAGEYGDSVYFTIKFPMPIIQHIHPAFKRLHFELGFYEMKSTVEFTPCYLMNFNHVSLSKIQKPRNSPSIYGSIGDDGLYTKFSHQSGKYMNFSSSNILLLGVSAENTSSLERENIDKCFEYAYWCLPSKKTMNSSPIHNLIYHSHNEIKRGGVIQLNKTLLKILKIGNKETLQILPNGKTICCHFADVALLVDDGEKITSEKRRLFLIDAIATSFKEGDILNAIIISQNISNPKYSLVVGSVGKPIALGDVTSLLSIIMWKELQYLEENSSVTRVGKLSKLTNNVLELVKNNSKEKDVLDISSGWNVDVEEKIKKSLDELFPLYLIDDDTVHQLSPTMISFLLSYDSKILRDREALITIIKILDLISINSEQWGESASSQLYISNKSDHLTSTTKNLLVESLPILVNMMVYSRIFSEHYLE